MLNLKIFDGISNDITTVQRHIQLKRKVCKIYIKQIHRCINIKINIGLKTKKEQLKRWVNHFIMIKGTINKYNTVILNLFSWSNIALIYIKQNSK